MVAKALSIGIIGGADGPTAIFITGPDWTETVAGLLLLAVGVIGALWLRKRGKKEENPPR